MREELTASVKEVSQGGQHQTTVGHSTGVDSRVHFKLNAYQRYLLRADVLAHYPCAHQVQTHVFSNLISHSRLKRALRSALKSSLYFNAVLNEFGLQWVHDSDGFHEAVDIPILEFDPKKQEKKIWLWSLLRRPFVLYNSPLLRLGIITCNDQRTLLIVVGHQLICNATSLQKFTLELIAFLDMNGGANNREVKELVCQSYDVQHTSELCWRRYLADATVTRLPFVARCASVTFRDEISSTFILSERLVQHVRQCSIQMAVPTDMIYLTTFLLWLSDILQQPYLLVNVLRNTNDVGMCSVIPNLLDMRPLVMEGSAVKSNVAGLRCVALSVQQLFDSFIESYDELVQACAIAQFSRVLPLVETSFFYESLEDHDQLEYDFEEVFHVQNKDEKASLAGLMDNVFPFLLHIKNRGNVTEVVWRLQEAYALEGQIQQYQNGFEQKLILFLNSLMLKSHLSVEFDQLCRVPGHLACLYDQSYSPLLPEILLKRVHETPESIAVVVLEQTLTYRQWWYAASLFSNELLKQGVQENDWVALCVEDPMAWLIALVSCWIIDAVPVSVSPQYQVEINVRQLKASIISEVSYKNRHHQLHIRDAMNYIPIRLEVLLAKLNCEGQSIELSKTGYEASCGIKYGAKDPHQAALVFYLGDRVDVNSQYLITSHMHWYQQVIGQQWFGPRSGSNIRNFSLYVMGQDFSYAGLWGGLVTLMQGGQVYFKSLKWAGTPLCDQSYRCLYLSQDCLIWWFVQAQDLNLQLLLEGFDSVIIRGEFFQAFGAWENLDGLVSYFLYESPELGFCYGYGLIEDNRYPPIVFLDNMLPGFECVTRQGKLSHSYYSRRAVYVRAQGLQEYFEDGRNENEKEMLFYLKLQGVYVLNGGMFIEGCADTLVMPQALTIPVSYLINYLYNTVATVCVRFFIKNRSKGFHCEAIFIESTQTLDLLVFDLFLKKLNITLFSNKCCELDCRGRIVPKLHFVLPAVKVLCTNEAPKAQLLAACQFVLQLNEKPSFHDRWDHLGGDWLDLVCMARFLRYHGYSFDFKPLSLDQNLLEWVTTDERVSQCNIATSVFGELSSSQYSVLRCYADCLEYQVHWVQLELPGWFEKSDWVQALSYLCREYKTLRTGFKRDVQGWEAFVSTYEAITVDHCCEVLSSVFQSSYLEKLKIQSTSLGVQVDCPPLVKLLLYPGYQGGQVLWVFAHKLILDTFSWEIFLEQLLETVWGDKIGLIQVKPMQMVCDRFVNLDLDHAFEVWRASANIYFGVPTDFFSDGTSVLSVTSVSAVFPRTHDIKYWQNLNKTKNIDRLSLLMTALTQVLGGWCDSEYVKFDLELPVRGDFAGSLMQLDALGCYYNTLPIVLPVCLEDTLKSIELIRDALLTFLKAPHPDGLLLDQQSEALSLHEKIFNQEICVVYWDRLPYQNLISYMSLNEQISDFIPGEFYKKTGRYLLWIHFFPAQGHWGVRWVFDQKCLLKATVEMLLYSFMRNVEKLLGAVLKDSSVAALNQTNVKEGRYWHLCLDQIYWSSVDMQGRHFFNMSALLSVEKRHDYADIVDALKTVIERDPYFRLVLDKVSVKEGETWVQRKSEMPLLLLLKKMIVEINFTGLAVEQVFEGIEKQAHYFRAKLQYFGLPLVRFVVFRTSPQQPHYILILMHRLVMDEYSVHLLIERVDQCLFRKKDLKLFESPKLTWFDWLDYINVFPQQDDSGGHERALVYKHQCLMKKLSEILGCDLADMNVSWYGSVEVRLQFLPRVQKKTPNFSVEIMLIATYLQTIASWLKCDVVLAACSVKNRVDVSTAQWCTILGPLSFVFLDAFPIKENEPFETAKELFKNWGRIVERGFKNNLKHVYYASNIDCLPFGFMISFDSRGIEERQMQQVKYLEHFFSIPEHADSARRSLLELKVSFVGGEIYLKWEYDKTKFNVSHIESLVSLFAFFWEKVKQTFEEGGNEVGSL